MSATRPPARSAAATARSAAAARSGTPVRPVLSAREAQALRESLALRQALAARQAGTATTPRTSGTRAPARRKPATGRTATARTGTARTAATRIAATARTAAPRTGAPRTATRRAPARPTAPRRRSASRVAAPRTGPRWSTRAGVVTLGTLVLPAVLALVLPAGQAPNAGRPDATALALTAQNTLLSEAGRYRQLERVLAERRTDLHEAQQAEQAARAAAEADQRQVGAAAAGRYRAAPEARLPLLALSVDDPTGTPDVLYLQTVAERSDRALEGSVVRAARTGAAAEAAAHRVAEARAEVAVARRQAAAALTAVRKEAGGLDVRITGRLAALGIIPVGGDQQARNDRALQRWQGYLARLAEAGITPPRAADLRDPAHLPPGMSPALDAAGLPIPGIAWAVIGSSPVTVLSAETVTAVSSALSQLGKPFAPGTSGPDSYDCGGFTAAAWLLAGYAVPSTPQEQWAGGTVVPMSDLQVGDIVFPPGGKDAGIYLGEGDVVGSSAGTYRVGVRPLTAGSTAVRVPLGPPAQPNAPLTAAVRQGPCGAPLPAPGPATPAWGGYRNGQIPPSALCPLGVGSHALRCDAAASYARLSDAYTAAFGTPLCITDSYRSFAAQVAAFYLKPGLAAVPGTSNHGWALAVDLCDGINIGGSRQWTWMVANAGRFGFVQPDWAAPRGEKPEPWHWEYGYIS